MGHSPLSYEAVLTFEKKVVKENAKNNILSNDQGVGIYSKNRLHGLVVRGTIGLLMMNQ